MRNTLNETLKDQVQAHLGLVVDRVVLEQVFKEVLSISPVCIIPAILHTH